VFMPFVNARTSITVILSSVSQNDTRSEECAIGRLQP